MTPKYKELLEAHERGHQIAREYEDKCLYVSKTFMQHMRYYLGDRLRAERPVPTPLDKGRWQLSFTILFPNDVLPCQLVYTVLDDTVEYVVQVLTGPTVRDSCPATSEGTNRICDSIFILVVDACENALQWFHDGMNEPRFGIGETSRRNV